MIIFVTFVFTILYTHHSESLVDSELFCGLRDLGSERAGVVNISNSLLLTCTLNPVDVKWFEFNKKLARFLLSEAQGLTLLQVTFELEGTCSISFNLFLIIT